MDCAYRAYCVLYNTCLSMFLDFLFVFRLLVLVLVLAMMVEKLKLSGVRGTQDFLSIRGGEGQLGTTFIRGGGNKVRIRQGTHRALSNLGYKVYYAITLLLSHYCTLAMRVE